MAEANPAVRQRELGLRLRELRGGLGLTVEDVAERLLCSATKISRIETASRRASLRDVRDLCQVYGVTEPEASRLMDLAKQAREPGWWMQYEDLGLGPYLGLEQEAATVTHFSMYFVNGLLQTEDYARAIIKAIAPQMSPRTLDERVEARLRRQHLLDLDNRPRVRSLMDEAVLRRQVGGPAVMRTQLNKILHLAHEDKATAQVIPFSAGAHASADSNFTFLEFGDSSLPSIVHVEGLISTLYQKRPAVVARYRETLDYLRDVALNPRDSLDLIAHVRDMHISDS